MHTLTIQMGEEDNVNPQEELYWRGGYPRVVIGAVQLVTGARSSTGKGRFEFHLAACEAYLGSGSPEEIWPLPCRGRSFQLAAVNDA